MTFEHKYMIFTALVITFFLLIVWIASLYDTNYKVGTIVYMCDEKNNPEHLNGYRKYYIYCITKDAKNISKSYKLQVEEELFNKYKVGDLFPVKF